MTRYLLTRLGLLVVSAVLAAVIIFAVLRMLPGDAAGSSLGVGTTADQLAQLRGELGLDQSVPAQFGQWVAGLFGGDAGTSFVSRIPVGELISSKLAVTVPLSLMAFAIAVVVSLPLGVYAAVKRRSPIGVAVSAIAQLGVAVPIFWIGVLLIAVFSLRLGWFPPGGFPREGWSDPVAALRSLTLPAFTIAIVMSSVMVRYIRSATLDVVGQEYIRTARSLGYGLWRALARHGLRNGAVAVVAILGIELATSFLGAVVVENVFALPGLGTLLLDSVTARDLPVVQMLVLSLTIVVLLMNFVVDLIQRGLDPRLRSSVLAGA